MKEETRGMIRALQTARVRGGMNIPTTRQRDGERTLALTYARVVGGDKTIKVEPLFGTTKPEGRRVRDDWADK